MMIANILRNRKHLQKPRVSSCRHPGSESRYFYFLKCLIIIATLSISIAQASEVSAAARDNSNPRAGTTLALTTAVQFPQPLTIGIEAKRDSNPNVVAFFEGGFFKYPFSGSSRSVSDYSIETGIRYHPFSSGFFVTGELGFRHIGVNVDISNLKQDGIALANTAVGSIGTYYLGLLAGYQWKLTQSLSLAMDLGIQLALLHSGSITINPINNEDGTDYTVEDSKEMNRISGLPVPQIAVFRLIWNL